MINKIEIDIGTLIKQEKHYEYVTVHPKIGKPFKRKQLIGRKKREDIQQKQKIIFDYENMIRDQIFESCGAFDINGNFILHKNGEKDRINFTLEEMTKLKGVIFTHNHPSGGSFSKEDVKFACRVKIKELRVITSRLKGKIYILRMKDRSNMSPEIWNKIESSFNENNIKLRNEFINKIQSGDITINEANAKYYDKLWFRIAKDIPEIEYISD